MLGGETGYGGFYGEFGFLRLVAAGNSYFNIFPPVELGHLLFGNVALVYEPGLQTESDKEVDLGIRAEDFGDGWVGEVVVVGVGDANYVGEGGNFGRCARCGRVSLGSGPLDAAASGLEDRVEENAETGWFGV